MARKIPALYSGISPADRLTIQLSLKAPDPSRCLQAFANHLHLALFESTPEVRWEQPSPMHGGMPFLRWSALPEKMISMPRISALPPSLQRSCHGRAANRMGKLRQGNGQRLVMESFQSPQPQGPSSEHSYRQAFGIA
jgi:hypothetical protein